CLLECLVPPQCSATRSRAHGFRNGPVQVERDRLNRLADRGARVLLLQSPAVDEVLAERLFVGTREIIELLTKESHARIGDTRLIARRWKRKQGDVLVDGEHSRFGTVHVTSSRVADERENVLDLGILRKRARVLHIHCAALGVKPPVRSILIRNLSNHSIDGARRTAQLVQQSSGIANHQWIGVYNQTVALLRLDGQSSDNRSGKAALNRVLQFGTTILGAEAGVLSNNQYLRSGAHESAKLRPADAASVGKHLDGTYPAAETREVDEFRVQPFLREFKEQLAFLRVPIERNKPIIALQPGDAACGRVLNRVGCLLLRAGTKILILGKNENRKTEEEKNRLCHCG